ncbi:MAG: serine/threonine-protein kinase [Planctomycetota bacterium]|jgi:serine/threonine protein kinase
MMTPQRYGRLYELFAATCELAAPQRAAVLDQECAGDPDLRLEAEVLLANDAGAGTFLEDPSISVGPAFGAGVAPWECEALPESGEAFGSYRIVEEIGRGGQGVVYLATDTRLARRVALKVLSSGFLADPRLADRFEREAQAAGRLRHPGICAVHDVGVENGLHFIAMRYVEGQTLAETISAARRGDGEPWDLTRALAILERTARAAHAAHEAGVIHRDLKPGNVMVTPQDQPVVLDFGLARDDQGGAGLTLPGDLFGTPAYMAPEQIDPQFGCHPAPAVRRVEPGEPVPFHPERAAFRSPPAQPVGVRGPDGRA